MAAVSVRKLESEGWVRRSTASGARLHEAIENYQLLGFEVKVIPARDLDPDGCTECFTDEAEATMVIFTRDTGLTKPGDVLDEDTDM